MEKDKQITDSVQILWHGDYWDGPLSGMLLYKNEPHWFDLKEEEEELWNEELDDWNKSDWYRKYNVFRLTEEQKWKLFALHGLWNFMMGLHTDYFPYAGRKTHILHYGICDNSKDSWKEWEKLSDKFKEQHGEVYDEKLTSDCIGWITWDQLFESYKNKEKNVY